MKKLSIDPRPPINQGIDRNNPTVLRHTEIEITLLYELINSSSHMTFTLNPFGTAPLSGLMGAYLTTLNPIQVTINDDKGSAPVRYSYTPKNVGPYLIPILGFTPDAKNSYEVFIPYVGTRIGTVQTSPLPLTDAEIPPDPNNLNIVPPVFTGFPIYEVTKPSDPSTSPAYIRELYFSAFFSRFNVGVDQTGVVRWYTSPDIPALNLVRLRNGHFIGGAYNFNQNRTLYEFDMLGRVHSVYILDNMCHHSIYELPNGNILIPSGNDADESTVEDGLSIVDLTTGLEVAYYDMRQVLEPERPPRPNTINAGDWLHINSSYYDETNNLIVSSGRHQGVFGINYNTGELSFVLGNREVWSEEFQQYLLTPVDESGNQLYDFSIPEDLDRADKEFWSWGHHSAVEISSGTPGIVEFILLDNGNFRSRSDERSIIANDNHSKMAHYRIDLSNMTVRKMNEFGREVGSRGYSSYVSNVDPAANGNYLINFGAPTIDENGRTLTESPGFTDIVDPLEGEQAMGKIVLLEVNPTTKEVFVEFTISSGRFKNRENDGLGVAAISERRTIAEPKCLRTAG